MEAIHLAYSFASPEGTVEAKTERVAIAADAAPEADDLIRSG